MIVTRALVLFVTFIIIRVCSFQSPSFHSFPSLVSDNILLKVILRLICKILVDNEQQQQKPLTVLASLIAVGDVVQLLDISYPAHYNLVDRSQRDWTWMMVMHYAFFAMVGVALM